MPGQEPGTDPKPGKVENLGLSPSEGRGGGVAFIRTFPCSGCGAKLTYRPGTRDLKCEFCGTVNHIAENDERIEELDFDAYVHELETAHESFEAQTVRCTKCGAEQQLAGNLFAGKCAFCGTGIVGEGYARRYIKPRALIPFQVDRAAAQEHFRRWVRGLWLAPGELKRRAQSEAGMTGTYLPFWTYDCHTASDYEGERGEDYYTTETYRDAQGRTATRQVKHTNWFPASGHVEHFHDDVVVMATDSLPPMLRGAASSWKLEALVPYQPEFVSGYMAEAYRIGLREGYPVAKESIDATIYGLVRRDIGGDQQRVHGIRTQYTDVRFKHVLLPVWVSAYRFGDKTYRFLVNGQTGEVAGESPISWQKATLLVIAIVVVLLVALVLSQHR